jgi:hypothetical protein
VGLDASVRCRCWEEGKTTPCPFPDLVALDHEMDSLELTLAWEGNEEAHRRFERWRAECCPHDRMLLVNEWISNWSGVRLYQQALRAAGAERFPVLLAQIPDVNGGRTEPEMARRALAELDAFERSGPFGWRVWLADAERGARLIESVGAYGGVFLMTGKHENLDMGTDRNGFFIQRPKGEELFRSMAFEQIKHGDTDFEFRDEATDRRFRCRTGIEWKELPFPRRLAVEQDSDGPQHHSDVTERLRRVFTASVETGRPVTWF